MGKIKAKILGNEYTFKGENEELIRKAVEEVDKQLQSVMEKYRSESLQTIYTLAAVNIAEKLKYCEMVSKKEQEYLVDEIRKITLYLIEKIS
ncbi:MAG: cell division protein ZapA [Candidatus Kapaibacteriota bacterium]|jgi:cell division protein ZapA (FtsZ GTPase activity inhibitor)